MTMVERMARAICIAQGVDPEKGQGNDYGWPDRLPLAQAALEAMISEGAISDRMNSDGAFQLFTGERIDENSKTLARQCFRAMIKAAIAER